MELTVLHLFPELMSLYGEYANLTVLSRHLQTLGVKVEIKKISCDDEPDFSQADMLYMGAGTERGQKYALERLTPWAESLGAFAVEGKTLLFTGNAMETLGASITDARGKVYKGLGLADFTTLETDRRSPGDVIASPALWDAPAVGFMNKCSTTSGVTTPLFTALPMGFGNDAEHGPEGFASGNVFATHITGPVLVKNPDFLNLIIHRLAALKNWPLPADLPSLPHERDAYAVTLRELQARCH